MYRPIYLYTHGKAAQCTRGKVLITGDGSLLIPFIYNFNWSVGGSLTWSSVGAQMKTSSLRAVDVSHGRREQTTGTKFNKLVKNVNNLEFGIITENV